MSWPNCVRLVRGAGHLERFDYWLANFKYLRAMGKLNCTWAELNASLESMKQTDDAAARKEIALRKALPLRIRLIRELTYVQQFLLDTVYTKGEMGTVTNWQQHVFPLLLDPFGEGDHRGHGRTAVGQGHVAARVSR